MHGCILVLRGLKLQRIDVYHLDRSSGRRRHEDDRRHPMIGHEGEPLDKFLVGYHPIVSGRQHAIDARADGT
jgi:hypothetical protein